MQRLARAVRRHLTYANVIATIALAMATAGTAWAAGIGSAGIADNSIQSRDIRNGSVTSADVANGGVQLWDISAAARRSLAGADGADGADGTNGTNGKDGATGPQGPAGPQGPPGAPGTVIDSIDDLDGLACSTGQRTGTVDVQFGQTVNSVSAISMRCVLAPIACTAQPQDVHVANWSCDGNTGAWQVVACEASYWNLDGQSTNGCEYYSVFTGDETCDGLDNDADGTVDEDTTPPVDHGFLTCDSYAGSLTLTCYEGWANNDGDMMNGCEGADTLGDCRAADGSVDDSDVPSNPYPYEQDAVCTNGVPSFPCRSPGYTIPEGYVWAGPCPDWRTP